MSPTTRRALMGLVVAAHVSLAGGMTWAAAPKSPAEAVAGFLASLVFAGLYAVSFYDALAE